MLVMLALMFAGPLLAVALGRTTVGGDWRTAPHRSVGLAPDPATHREAIVQVYAARTFGWRGAFAVHTWVATKRQNADRYLRYEVIGWYARAGGSAVSVSSVDAPDTQWYGARPWVLRELRGADAEAVIAKLAQAVDTYPYPGTYTMWPGPNSNTFVAHIGRAIPELRLTLPSIAIGKDYFPAGEFAARSPSGTGYQFSVAGVVGVIAGGDEGLEVNVLGMVLGIDPRGPALKLPGIGLVPGGG